MKNASLTSQSLLLISLPILLFSAACTPAGQAAGNRQITPDFYVSIAPKNFKAKAPLLAAGPIERSDCEARLTKALCETDASSQEISSHWDKVKCAETSAEFLPLMMKIYDETPEVMRRSLCSLERVFLSNQIPSTAFASSIVDQNDVMIGGYVGFRKDSFLKQPTSLALITWKEQLAFGGDAQFLSNNPNLVQMNYGLKMEALDADGLFYVLMHELGHLIDFNNNITLGTSTKWQHLSWANESDPLPSATYLEQDQFCYYNCSKFVNPQDALAIYTSLSKSGFVTSYAGTNPTEDFAEFWAWHLALKYKDAHFTATVPGQGTVNLTEGWKQSSLIQNKLSVVDALWNSPSLNVDNHTLH